MIEVPMNQDLGSYKPKLIGPFTTRQVVCFTPAFAISIAIYQVFKSYFPGVPIDVVSLLLVIPALPAAFFGCMKPYGMLPEVWLKSVWRTSILAPQKRYLAAYNRQEVLFGMLEEAELGKQKHRKRKRKFKLPEGAVL